LLRFPATFPNARKDGDAPPGLVPALPLSAVLNRAARMIVGGDAI